MNDDYLFKLLLLDFLKGTDRPDYIRQEWYHYIARGVSTYLSLDFKIFNLFNFLMELALHPPNLSICQLLWRSAGVR
jgi:hypothetical protein